MDFIARLAALVPKPRVNLTRYHGVLARGGHPPNHQWRGLVTPAKRGKGVKRISNDEVRSAGERHAAMTWAQRLKRVFNIDIEVCGRCGGSAKVIACIEDQDIIDRILAHLRAKEQDIPTLPLLLPRASQLIPGDHLRHCIFSLGRARGSRFQVNSIQSAGTPLRNSLV